MDVRSMFSALGADDGSCEQPVHWSPGKMAPLLTKQEPTTPHEDPTMTKLKTQVAEHAYHPDPALVADAILEKLRMVRWARTELVSEPDRSRQPKLRGL
jgi:hypothetical protein